MGKKVLFVIIVWIAIAFVIFTIYLLREVSPVKEFIAWTSNMWWFIAAIGAGGIALSTWIIKHDFNPKTNSKYYEQNAEKATEKHWNDLAILCQEVADKMDAPFSIDNRYSSLPRELDKYDDGIRTLMFVSHWEDMDAQIAESESTNTSERADWALYGNLLLHLKAEDSEWETKMSVLKDAVTILHNELYALSQVAEGITKKWQIILTPNWSSIDGAVEAGVLSTHLKSTTKPMEHDVMQSLDACIETITPIRVKLWNVAKRRTFKGECPACP